MPSHSHELTTGGVILAVSTITEHSAMPLDYGYNGLKGIGWFNGEKKNVAGIAKTGGSGGHTHPISTTSTNTGSAGSSNPTAISVQDPYVTVYMWRRIK